MTQNQADILQQELKVELSKRFRDISVGFNIFEKKNLLVIHLFWNRISNEHWNNSKRFNCPIKEYPLFLEKEIMPFMEKQAE